MTRVFTQIANLEIFQSVIGLNSILMIYNILLAQFANKGCGDKSMDKFLMRPALNRKRDFRVLIGAVI